MDPSALSVYPLRPYLLSLPPSITVLQSMKLGMDVNRHKEIIVKSISALLLLLLKHLKLNHIYQVSAEKGLATATPLLQPLCPAVLPWRTSAGIVSARSCGWLFWGDEPYPQDTFFVVLFTEG